MENQYYDPSLREAEKQRSRERDHDDIASGRVSALELHDRNDFFSGFDIPNAVIDGWKEFE